MFLGPRRQRMALDVYFEGPGCQRTAPDVYFEGSGSWMPKNGSGRLFRRSWMPKNGSKRLFQRSWAPRMAPDVYFEVLDTEEWLRTFISKVQNTEGMFWTHLKILFDDKGSRNKFWTSISKAKESENEFWTSISKIKEAENLDSHTKVFPYEGSRKLGLPYESFPIQRQGNPKMNSELPYRR
ncbi:uncharacterized protein OCT59_026294 [Rhizophagus irregularis]|uniref:uncharacterized protein n=1 Tax=Rhizophagus irregularis TaxID=588596 RepID=UPI003323AD2C|nr:hypothetical protein OCT59_026294 [Rhizophagus irregularis]